MNNIKAEHADGPYYKLNKNHLQKLLDDGFCYVETTPGNVIKVTTKELYFDKKEMEILKQQMDKEKNEGDR